MTERENEKKCEAKMGLACVCNDCTEKKRNRPALNWRGDGVTDSMNATRGNFGPAF